ncbi:MAG: Fe-S-cluster-containing hydrogenase [Fimbriimonadaceae bacterium]|nr:Fe-S-cluster-containing hydrogenase [Fimbriimonadaceae bacterium]
MYDPKNEKSAPNAFFRGLDEAQGGEEAKIWREDEFPHRRSIPEMDRRDVLKLMGGTMAIAGLAGSGCRSLIMPQEKLVSFVQAPEERVNGVSKHFATVTADGGDVMGILVRQYEGRPVKIEGNPNHPASLGACDARTLATIYDLYDPDRLNSVTYSGSVDSWSGYFKSARQNLNKGGVAILTGRVTSPSLAAAIQRFIRSTNGRWYQWEPVNNDNEREGQALAFNASVSPVYDFSRADVVVSLDCDVFDELAGATRHMGDIMGRRNPESGSMSRLYAFESSPTTFGAIADHRVPVRASQMLAVVKSLASQLGIAGATSSNSTVVAQSMISALAAELRSASGRSILVAGRHLPAAVHAAVIAINEFLSAPVTYLPSPRPWGQHKGNDIKALADEIRANRVKSLLIIGGNPAYDAPADLDFKSLIGQVPWSAHLSLHDNETAYAAKWQLPMSHYLECWGDHTAYDGTVSLQQPLVQPLFDSRSALQMVDALAGPPTEQEINLVRANYPALSTEDAWNGALAKGVVPRATAPQANAIGSVQPNLMAALSDSPAISGLEVRFAHDSGVLDGRFTNNPWLMEMPRPLTNLTWDNAIEVGFKTAKDLGLPDGYVDKQKLFGLIPFHGDAPLVRLTVGGQSIVMPVYVNLGVAEGTLIVRLGYGRERAGQVGTKGDEKKQGGGFNTYAIRSTKGMWLAGAQVEKTSGDYPLANSQFHNTLDVEVIDRNRDVIRHATFADYQSNPAIFAGMGAAHHGSEGDHGESGDHGADLEHAGGQATDAAQPEGGHVEGGHGEGSQSSGTEGSVAPGLEPNPLNLYPGDDYKEIYDQNPQWAMTVDLSLCTGCNACVIACQSENNIPTVGKYQVMRGREMHWIRIDRYYKGTGETLDYDNPPIYFQPLACVHCEQAPCEPVCPVAATTHSGEGINQMVYNRCVGTRYCSNNCPYKVRRFNFLHYTGKVHDTPVLRLLQNPDVTVRTRGVMEKCTYCVQRISAARIHAKVENRKIEDGEVVTACQQACPAKAIVFGNKSDTKSKIAESRRNQRNYVLLESTNTRPRTTYLGRVENPNPEVNA